MRRNGMVQTCAMMAFMLPLCGCENALFTKANPRTEIRYGPASLYNSKDVDATLDEFSYTTADGGSATLKGLILRDNASGVRNADVNQINALVNQQLAFNAGIEAFGKAFTMGAQAVMPWLGMSATESSGWNLNTPWGGFGSTNTRVPTTQPAADASVLEEILKRIVALEARLPATQPE